MALLSVTDRTRVWRGLMRRWSNGGESCAFLKSHLYDPTLDTGAVVDVDAWVDGRQGLTAPDTVGFNGGLNVAYRALFTATQKTDLLLAVAAMRRGVGYIKQILGEVD